jgi:hypothetical protein
MKRHTFVTTLVIAGLIVLSNTGPISAGEQVPFKGNLEGLHVSRTSIGPGQVFDVFELTGNASHLGKFDMVIESEVDFRNLPPRGVGVFTITAANGDILVADQTGASRLVEPGIVLITEDAIIDPDRSTGRFAGATGTFTVGRLAVAATGVTGVTIGSFNGTISSPGAN